MSSTDPASSARRAPEPDRAAARMTAALAAAGPGDHGTLSWAAVVDRLLAAGHADIPGARLAEGHIDAVRILAQAGVEPVGGARYGVWASRSHGTGVRATRSDDGSWALEGTLRFASGAGVLDRALVPVWLAPDEAQLLDVPVADWAGDERSWATTAMEDSRSLTIDVDSHHAPGKAREIGPRGWYLDRPGFFAGGIGPAAVWAGGGARVVDELDRALAAAPPNRLRDIHVGRARVELATAVAVVRDGAARLDVLWGEVVGDDGPVQDLRVAATLARVGVATAVDRLLEATRRAVGPAGLALDADLTRAVDDLDLYARQLSVDGDCAWLATVGEDHA